jgi:hypothetical protein
MGTGPQSSNQRNVYSYVQNTDQTSQNNAQAANGAYVQSSRRNKRGGNTTMSVGGPPSQGSTKNGAGYANRVKRGTGANTNHSHGLGAAGTHLDPLDFDANSTLLQFGASQQATG